MQNIRLDGERPSCSHTKGIAKTKWSRYPASWCWRISAVLEFGSHQISLEDVFLQVTRGYVQ